MFKAQNLITKGLLGLKKALSLISKGTLDLTTTIVPPVTPVFHGGAGTSNEYSIKLFFHVQGKCAVKENYEYNINGIKLFELVKKFNLKAKKSSNLLTSILLKAVVKDSFTVVANTIGILRQNLEANLNIKGTKQTPTIEEIILKGIQRTNFKVEKEITAQKLFNITQENNLRGIKQINSQEEVKIKGTKDITNILVALDLI